MADLKSDGNQCSGQCSVEALCCRSRVDVGIFRNSSHCAEDVIDYEHEAAKDRCIEYKSADGLLESVLVLG